MHRTGLAAIGIAIASVCLGVSAHDEARYDRHTDSNMHQVDDRLSADTRRALRRFNEDKHRDYRRLGERHFDSRRAREQAYRELRRRHRSTLRDILGESRFNADRFRRYHDEQADHEYHRGGSHGNRGPARAFDPATVSASLAARWALDESDRDDLADVLEEYREDTQELHEERFDSRHERRAARRELNEDYRDDLADILDDASAADVDDILEHLRRPD